MRYYVEGSPSGPESFTRREQALAWAAEACERFGAVTEVYDSDTHDPLPQGGPTGASFAAFRPRRATTAPAAGRAANPAAVPHPRGGVVGFDTRHDGTDYRVCPGCADDPMFAGSEFEPLRGIPQGGLRNCELCDAFLG